MTKSVSKFGVLFGAAALVALAGQASAQTCPEHNGPDVIVGDITGPQNYTFANINNVPYEALSLGTTSCNVGTVNVQWNALPAVTHPVIGGTLYRLQTVNGATRFEQLGQSWLKHAFTALTGSICCSCNGQGGSVLGIGCSDPYTAGRNGSQGGMGPKYQVNAALGNYSASPPTPSGGNMGRIQIPVSELAVTAGGAGAAVRYFGECQYVTSDDAKNNNATNNASIREISTSTTGTNVWNFAFVGNTIRERSALEQWKIIDPTVTLSTVLLPTTNSAGPVASVNEKFVVASKATDIGGGMWHYEYAVYNMNSDRCAGSFSIPVSDLATVTNIGFRGVDYFGGDGVSATGTGGTNYSNAAWTSTRASGNLTWATTPFSSTTQNANAIRWGTTYNFRFDANVAPAALANATVGLWKAGLPATSSFTASAQVPGTPTCVADVDNGSGTGTHDGSVTIDDLLYYLTIFEAGMPGADVDDGSGTGTHDGGVTIDDLLYYLVRFEAGC